MTTCVVSFVIPVKNDATRLARCLSTIRQNSYPRESVEVIVADNGSSDQTGAVARNAGARVLWLPELRVSELRNRAAAVAKGDVLAFVDADHEIAASWIDGAIAALSGRQVGAVGALYSTPSPGTWVQRAYGALRGRTIGQSDVDWLGSGNLAAKRTAFQSVGGFDETLESCEDVDFCQRLIAGGWRIVGDERLASVHLGDPDTLAKLFLAELWRGRDNLRVTFRGRLRLRDLPGILVPISAAVSSSIAIGTFLALPWLSHRALPLLGASLGAILVLAGLRAIRMSVSAGLRSPVAIAQAFVVALTYDVARAGALVARATHHRRVQRNRTPSSVPQV